MLVGSRAGLVLVIASLSLASERYASIRVTDDGGVTISTADGRTITAPKEPEQVGANDAKVAPDGLTAGWLVLYANCCTSYPLALKLQLFRDGRLRTVDASPAIFKWMFQDGGRRIAYEEEPAHFGVPHYVLLDAATGGPVADYVDPVDRDSRLLPRVDEPAWVRVLDDAYRSKR